MRNEHNLSVRSSDSSHSSAQCRDPVRAARCVPLSLNYALTRWVLTFPVALPVLGTRVTETRENQRC
jgi:hypothetical protein